MRYEDLSGKVYGKFTVLRRGESVGTGRKKKGRWLCRCECGKEVNVDTYNLKKGYSRSCGCSRKEWLSEGKPAIRHGKCGTSEWSMYRGAYTRAKQKGLDFDLKVTDLSVPETCPLLGISLKRGVKGRLVDNSPTLDRIDNTKGYTKDNVWVISHKANTIKSYATYEEIELVAKNLKEKITNGRS